MNTMNKEEVKETKVGSEELDINTELGDIWAALDITREALSSNGLEIATITSILVEKGIITEEEYTEKRIQVSREILEYIQGKLDKENKDSKVTIT